MMTTFRPAATALIVAAAAPVHAAGAAQQSPEIVVTATRVAQTVDATLAPVTVITREQIEQRQPGDMLQLLELAPGVDVARSGGPGSAINVFVRGTNSNHVLVLVDGVRAASASDGTFAWQSLLPDQIARVEIVRGPRAALYGSDAIGGVIQIFTRQPRGAHLRLEAGSFNTRGVNLGVGGGDRVRFSLEANKTTSDGISATNSKVDSPAFCPPFCTFDPDRDGYVNTSVSAGVEARLSPATRLSLRAWHAENRNSFDDGPGFTARTDSLNQTVSARLRQTVSEHWTQILTLGDNIDDEDNHDANPFSFSSRVTTHRRSVDWQNDLVLADNKLLVAGINYYDDAADTVDTSSATQLYDHSVSDRAVFVSYQQQFGRDDLQLAGRRDRHSAFGDESTGQIAWGHTVNSRLRLLASYGTAFRAPSLDELYHPGFGGFFAGNPALHPETSHSIEAGVRIIPGPGQRLNVRAYQTRVDNLIAFEGTNYQAVNIDSATIRGVEFEYARQSAPWDLTATATLQRARNNADDTPLLRRPDGKANLRLSRDIGTGARLGGEVLLSSKRKDVGNVTLPAYGLFNVYADFQLSRTLTLEGRLDNVFDQDYELVHGYNTPGRSLFVALRYGPGR